VRNYVFTMGSYISLILFCWTPALAEDVELLDISNWPGAKFHSSVVKVDGREGPAFTFSEGGIECPMRGKLSARSGHVGLWCRMPGDWPVTDVRTLFHVGIKGGAHISLAFIQGQLRALYTQERKHRPPL